MDRQVYFKLNFASFQGIKFNYDNPDTWFLINKQAAGHRQSPIHLSVGTAKPCELPPIAFKYYDEPLSPPLEVHNNGHTARIAINTTSSGTHPAICGGGLNDEYEVADIHFHWGSRTTPGSEHAINGQKFDLEMHIVHKNIKCPTLKDALNDPYGLAVLGILFKKSEASSSKSSGLHAFYDALPYISQYESKLSLYKPLTMQSFLGKLNTDEFFVYRGSLTVPPCAEAVTWLIFPDILPIQPKQLERFYNLYDGRGLPLLNNCRPFPLPMSSFLRPVFYRKGNGKRKSGKKKNKSGKKKKHRKAGK